MGKHCLPEQLLCRPLLIGLLFALFVAVPTAFAQFEPFNVQGMTFSPTKVSAGAWQGTVDASGTFWLTQRGNEPNKNCITKVAKDGQLLASFAIGKYGLSPDLIAVDKTGEPWIACREKSTLAKFLPNGELKTRFFINYGREDGRIKALAVDEQNNLWVACCAGQRNERDTVYKFDSCGRLLGNYPIEMSNPFAMVFDKDGHLWITEQGPSSTSRAGSVVLKMAPDGKVVGRYTPGVPLKLDGPRGIATDQEGNLWIAYWINNEWSGDTSGKGKIVKLSAKDGSVLETCSTKSQGFPERLGIDANGLLRVMSRMGGPKSVLTVFPKPKQFLRNIEIDSPNTFIVDSNSEIIWAVSPNWDRVLRIFQTPWPPR